MYLSDSPGSFIGFSVNNNPFLIAIAMICIATKAKINTFSVLWEYISRTFYLPYTRKIEGSDRSCCEWNFTHNNPIGKIRRFGIQNGIIRVPVERRQEFPEKRLGLYPISLWFHWFSIVELNIIVHLLFQFKNSFNIGKFIYSFAKKYYADHQQYETNCLKIGQKKKT